VLTFILILNKHNYFYKSTSTSTSTEAATPHNTRIGKQGALYRRKYCQGYIYHKTMSPETEGGHEQRQTPAEPKAGHPLLSPARHSACWHQKSCPQAEARNRNAINRGEATPNRTRDDMTVCALAGVVRLHVVCLQRTIEPMLTICSTKYSFSTITDTEHTA
jgi:hypothetical protein